jgi:hypothetical protein
VASRNEFIGSGGEVNWLIDAEGSMVWVSIRRSNCSCRRSMHFVVELSFY